MDDDFTPEDKYFYLYLLTNPHTNICGCYEISMKQMVRETGYNEDTVKRLLHRMEYTHGVIQYDPETKEVFVPKWGKYNWFNSKDTMAGVAKVVSCIKSERFKQAITEGPLMGVYRPPLGGGGTSVTDTVTDTVSVPVNKRPTLEEVKDYCKERGNGVDPERWFDYYTSNGWRVGKNPMKDWKAAVRTWERGDNTNKKTGPHTFFNYKEKGECVDLKSIEATLDTDFGGPPPGLERSRRNNTLLNYKEEGKSHPTIEEIKLDLNEL